MRRRDFAAGLLPALLSPVRPALAAPSRDDNPRLKGSFREPDRNGWAFVHLEGPPANIGFQHGYHLAAEIKEGFAILKLEMTHDSGKDWAFFRRAAQEVFWPGVEAEYRSELDGMVEGLKARGVSLDRWDVVAMNTWLEANGYYTNWYEKQKNGKKAKKTPTPEHCSAFIATGSYTTDGRIVMGHNAWTGYLDGARWRIVFDVTPERGHRFLMDGFPGLIHSADDFGVNAAGIMVTETTITGFSGFDPKGIPEFARARKALQYSGSIDEFERHMRLGNNGGYANNWLVGDRKTGEIASLELGLKNVTLRRSKDGYFGGSNFPVSEKLAREETDFKMDDLSLSANARRVRWDQLMAEHRGRIDVAAGQRFLADDYDTYDKKRGPNERSLCGRIDLSPRGVKPWQPEFGPAGAVQNKVTDSVMAERLEFVAALGPQCGPAFRAAEHLAKYPQSGWQKEYLKDLPAQPWTVFRAAR